MGALKSIANLFRLSLLGTTLLAPVLGILSATESVRWRAVVAVLLATTSLHVSMYVLNDIVDLDLDRTAPRRVQSPLVRGVISRRTAGRIVALTAFASFSLDRLILGYGISRESALALAFASLTLYDRYGKRCGFPPLTDFVQGLGCGLAVLYGGLAAGGVNRLSWTEAAFMTIYIAMANGIHGSLRDLDNDQAHGVRSTAIMLGATVDDGGLLLTVRLRVYGLALQVALGVTGALALAESAQRDRHDPVGLGLGAATILLSFGLLVRAYSYAASFHLLLLAGAVHLVVAILPALDAATSAHGLGVEGAITALCLGPLFASPRYRNAFLWVFGFTSPPADVNPYDPVGSH